MKRGGYHRNATGIIMAPWDNCPAQTRRTFLGLMARLGAGMAMAPVVWKVMETFGVVEAGGVALAAPLRRAPVRAKYATRLPGSGKVRCDLCPRHEVLRPGQRGFCLGRVNQGGELVTHAYGQPCVLNIDPVGKNPLSNFCPELQMLSVAHAGCNLRCRYCQNWQFAFRSPTETKNIPFDPEAAVKKMQAKRLGGVTFTYTEPTYCPEFVAEFAAFCAEHGLKRTLCTAGYIEKQPFKELLKPFDAVTITYKGATDKFYRDVVGGTLKPVLDAMETAKTERKWLEIATLVVPTLNDGRHELTTMAKWIHDHLGPDTPWNLERFDPQFKLRRLPTTSQTTMEMARDIGQQAGLRFVYISNLAPHTANHTYCPACGQVIVKRLGFKVLEMHMAGNTCGFCSAKIPGVWA